MSPRERQRFVALDGMRGFAALLVLFYHSEGFSIHTHLFSHGYLAVDFFFQLSDFVIAAAYEKRMEAIRSPFLFMAKERVIRLYPMALLGLAVALIAAKFGTGAPPLRLKGIVQQALFIPAILGNHSIYPYNNIQWSLFFELVANVIHVLILRRLRIRGLLVSVGIAAVFLAGTALRLDALNVGNSIYNMGGGAARAVFSYTLGVLAFRLFTNGSLPGMVRYFAFPVALLTLATIAPTPAGLGTAAWDFFAVAFLMPAALASAVNLTMRSTSARAAHVLGEISYPVYVTQQAAFYLFPAMLAGLALPGRVAAWVVIDVGFCAAAWVVLKVYDEPVRAFLRRLFDVRLRPPAESAP